MGPEGIILVNPPIITLQQSLTHSTMLQRIFCVFISVLDAFPNLFVSSLKVDTQLDTPS